MAFITLAAFSSCTTTHLFQGSHTPKYGHNLQELLMAPTQHTLRPDDKISVSIWNHDNISVGSVFGIYNSNEVYGKWLMLNDSGQVSLPRLGPVYLQGLTVQQAEARLVQAYSAMLVNPVINVRVLNREVTLLGEVTAPGNYLLEKETNSLAELLGRAEGLTFYGNPKAVQLVRAVNGQQRRYLIDLQKTGAVAQQQIVVMAGDVIYVPEKAGKKLDKKAPLLIPLSSAVTTVGIILSLVN